ncbi:TetR/AcrR family transcriptional regulator [Verminephrobacter aporrectodeae subsp. tuberculatae]|uniref:TetR/AcrR family transcriptional regulator n=2 Tax=Verminephrobacter TaxID=364316 RepID=A0ABT3KV73_9BURK|nr:TetR/AcrR family transcriptional regulator [Verminephrobacter aporrectodeae]MCW5222798.1 TetR/AcrR family transcriptional regulator [Verminephrobacter aporrectodeae subsp. tuberculatae]MCW5256974.1 TetR/AcrR family transcriptional regulator [Verminephrobacter aporrectodeae subsp. tuberculatae]MCW5288262.1 TetR/AcrR family transcriptional regulator [Verminephrobacter aporrectodeae subsp. tuberculatae]MCW5321814.1 TetR/AcrR family transcriptional regulator [Verminephrobacter aporrectodeae subs
MGDKFPFRARNPEHTKQLILDAARVEFSRAGLAGARVDRIAETSGANKRMIYHYFGSKEQLFTAVIEDAYSRIRGQEMQLNLDALAPQEAIRQLVEFTWEYYLANPEFITLVNSENLHQARHITGNRELRKLQKAYVETVEKILQRGEAAGVFRSGIDALQLCITIAAIGFYYLTNRHTGSVIFGFNFTSRKALAARIEFNVETIMRMVLACPDEA